MARTVWHFADWLKTGSTARAQVERPARIWAWPLTLSVKR